MLRQIPPSREESEQLLTRFRTAQAEPPVDIEDRKTTQYEVQVRVIELAEFLDATVENSREKSLALTHLEEVLMWTGKAVFA